MIPDGSNIVGMLKAGSMEAFDAVYHQYHVRLYHFALRITSGNTHQAEELSQSVFIRLWEVRHRLDEEKNLFAFLCTIAKNRFLNECSHSLIKYLHGEWVRGHLDVTDSSTEQEVERMELERLIREFTELLPPARKKIFIMSRMEGKPNKEISRVLNISESTVETQLGKALKFIRVELARYYAMPVGMLAGVMFFLT
jgi:RNA polymerase sigma-70 factor (ECF subfamily)